MTASQRSNHSSPTSDQPETLAEVVKELRASEGETQEIFRTRFNVARTYISNVERGESYPEGFVERLVEAYPDQETRLWDALECSRSQRPPKPTRQNQRDTPFQRRIETQIRTGRFAYAQRALLRRLIEETDDDEKYWLHERLYVTLLGLGEDGAAVEALEAAVKCALGAGLQEEELSSRARLASRYQIKAQFHTAHEVLDAGLRRFPDAARLWLRKGKVHWYEQAYSQAYAALTTAQEHGARRRSVLHARGQVLAEWGSFEAALADIAGYLAETKARSTDIASARSARAYVWGQQGELGQALTEFEEIEPLNPDSAWLYYRRGLCYVTVGRQKQAVSDLERALQCGGPSLNLPRKNHVIALLQQYGVSVAVDESTT